MHRRVIGACMLWEGTHMMTLLKAIQSGQTPAGELPSI